MAPFSESRTSSAVQAPLEFFLVDRFYAERARLFQLAAGGFAINDQTRLFRNAARRLAAVPANRLLRFRAGIMLSVPVTTTVMPSNAPPDAIFSGDCG